MAEIDSHQQQIYNQNYRQLIQEQQTLILSTATEQGEPNCSYAPYINDEKGSFYIYVSSLARHTDNMLKNHKASVLFIKGEQESQNLFARERVIFDCDIVEIQREDDRYSFLLNNMKQKFGETIQLLMSLPDFHLLALTPVTGKYVAGFGSAFEINMDDGSIRF